MHHTVRDRCPLLRALSQEVVLVGDIGGTNCRLVLWKIVPGRALGLDEILFQKVSPRSRPAAPCLHVPRQAVLEPAEIR